LSQPIWFDKITLGSKTFINFSNKQPEWCWYLQGLSKIFIDVIKPIYQRHIFYWFSFYIIKCKQEVHYLSQPKFTLNKLLIHLLVYPHYGYKFVSLLLSLYIFFNGRQDKADMKVKSYSTDWLRSRKNSLLKMLIFLGKLWCGIEQRNIFINLVILNNSIFKQF